LASSEMVTGDPSDMLLIVIIDRWMGGFKAGEAIRDDVLAVVS